MTSDQEHERGQLEAATSRAPEAGGELDAETAALRNGFFALGRALDTAAAEYDEAAAIARLQALCAENASVTAAGRTRRWTQLWEVVLGGALAASALIATVRIVASWRAADAVVVTPSAPRDNQVAVLPETSGDDSAQDVWQQPDAWNDPLDEEIVAAEDSLADLSGRPPGIDGALSDMNQTLEALADDLAGESL